METELDPNDLMIIEALAAGQTHQQAADHAGCSAKTIQRRLREPAFTQALRQRRAERKMKQLQSTFPESMVMATGPIRPTFVLSRGDYRKPLD